MAAWPCSRSIPSTTSTSTRGSAAPARSSSSRTAARTRSGASTAAEVRGTIRTLRMHFDGAALRGGEHEDVVAPPVDAGQSEKRTTTRIRPCGDHDRIGELVPDQRLHAAEEAREQHLRPGHARRDKTPSGVDHFDDYRLLPHVHPDTLRRSARDSRSFGRCIDVERLTSPGSLDAPRGLVCQHLRRRDRQPWLDREPSLELLVREGAEDARIPDHRVGPIPVQRSNGLAERRRHAQPRHAVVAGLKGGEELSRDVDVAGRTDRDQTRVGPDADSRETCQARSDPFCELGAGVHRQPGTPGRA